MTDHLCGSHCSTARHLAELTRSRVKGPKDIAVKSWCRICGVPVLLQLVDDYERAVRYFHALDDTPMVHKGVHAEQGGWGVSWRLDDVLSVVFLREHMEEHWPMLPWWENTYGEPEGEDQAILVLSPEDLLGYEDRYMDTELRLLQQYVNKSPRTREELALHHDAVWDTKEVGLEFEILGFKSPFVIAQCRRTGTRGTLIFQNSPRLFFGWDPERLI